VLRFALKPAFSDQQRKFSVLKLSITLAAAAVIVGSLALTAGAQTQAPGAATLRSQARNATSIQHVACGPRLFAGCPWGTRRWRGQCVPC
jgi:hypothetical protein